MNPTLSAESEQPRTVEYEPPQGDQRHLPIVRGEAEQTTTQDLVPLLLRRLRFLSLAFCLLYFFWLVSFLVAQGLGKSWDVNSWNVATAMAVLVVLAILAAFIWIRRAWSLLQLRAFELCFVVVLGSRCVIRGLYAFSDPLSRHVLELWRQAGSEEVLSRLLHAGALSTCFFPVLCMVAYGVFIPNTWRRCVLIVGLLWAIPLLTWVHGGVKNDIPVRLWFEPGVVATFLMLTLAAALAVFGAHRIETLRREALHARRLGQYGLRERLGGGGMGEVYLADHLLLRRPCALKVIRPERAGDAGMAERFEREVRATAQLTHPNAVQVFDYGRTREGTFYYVMEYLPGVTLEQMVKSGGPLPVARVIRFLRQLCGALNEAHAIGLIHRDIKPGNVMICERGLTPDVVKLLDFGLVQMQFSINGDGQLTQDGAILGTPAYMSPEQASGGKTVDARSDVYGLGALAYFLLTGQPPFANRSPMEMAAAHLYAIPAPLSSHRPDVPSPLEIVILRCLAKKPADRFQDVMSLDEALAQCESIGRVQAG